MKRIPFHIIFYFPALTIFLSIISGCGHLRLQQSPLENENTWKQYGGSIERDNVSHSILLPPFTKAWEYEINASVSEYSASATDSLLFIGNLQGDVEVIHLGTGKSIGNIDFGTSIIGTPIIDRDILYVALSNDQQSLIAYNLVKGEVLWKAKTGSIESSPLLINDRLYITTLYGTALCIEKSTGKEIWKYSLPEDTHSKMIHSSPASDGNVLVFGTDAGMIICLKCEDGSLLWKAKTEKSVFASPSISRNAVFVGSQDEQFYAFSLTDGTCIWKRAVGARVFTSQAVDENNVYVGTSAGFMLCLSKSSGAVVWKQQVESVIASAPILSGNVLYAGSLDRHLYALNSSTGEILWSYLTEGRIKAMPIIWNHLLIVIEDNRTVIGLKQEKTP